MKKTKINTKCPRCLERESVDNDYFCSVCLEREPTLGKNHKIERNLKVLQSYLINEIKCTEAKLMNLKQQLAEIQENLNKKVE